jgi:hypothetical protein
MSGWPDADAMRANLARVRKDIADAAARAGRGADEVTLVAVSKTFPADALRVLYDEGVRDFGESYVQEWLEKKDALPDDIRWHLIGHLQSNKAKMLGDDVHMIHAVDRSSLMKSLNKHSEAPRVVLLQVRLGGEETKSGVDPGGLLDLLERATSRERLAVHGLMTIPPPAESDDEARAYFRRLSELREECAAWLDARDLLGRHPMTHLSMGMSADYAVAVEEGASLVRVGSSLFGRRR